VVDASNPRWEQQIAAVNRILLELHLEQIPRLLVLNKTDLLDQSSVEAMLRRLSLETGAEALAISALNRKSFAPLLDRIDQRLGQRQPHDQTPEPHRGIPLQTQ